MLGGLELPQKGKVHLWYVPLDRPAESVASFARVLSPDELDRANRYVFESDRRHYMVARGTLRTILSAYLAVPPDSLRFEYGPRGKPSLAAVNGTAALGFNLAHSHECALLAFADGLEVGVDLEYLRSLESVTAIAERYFTREEQAQIARVDQARSASVFLTYWTRKEAILKLTGHGLAQPLDSVDVSWRNERSQLQRVEDTEGTAWRVTVQDLRPAPDYVGAVAVEGDVWSVQWRYAATGQSCVGSV